MAMPAMASMSLISRMSVEPVAVGKLDVRDQELEWRLGLVDGGHRGREAVGRHNLVPALAEHGRQVGKGVFIVFDEQDAEVAADRRDRSRRTGLGLCSRSS